MWSSNRPRFRNGIRSNNRVFHGVKALRVKHRRLTLEPLESRTLLSGAAAPYLHGDKFQGQRPPRASHACASYQRSQQRAVRHD